MACCKIYTTPFRECKPSLPSANDIKVFIPEHHRKIVKYLLKQYKVLRIAVKRLPIDKNQLEYTPSIITIIHYESFDGQQQFKWILNKINNKS
jgi:hypothetical protein